jgi:hypothetical protein
VPLREEPLEGGGLHRRARQGPNAGWRQGGLLRTLHGGQGLKQQAGEVDGAVGATALHLLRPAAPAGVARAEAEPHRLVLHLGRVEPVVAVDELDDGLLRVPHRAVVLQGEVLQGLLVRGLFVGGDWWGWGWLVMKIQ